MGNKIEQKIEDPKEREWKFVTEYNEDNTPKATLMVKESELTTEQHELLGMAVWNHFHSISFIGQQMFVDNLMAFLNIQVQAEEAKAEGKIILLNKD